MGVNRSMLDYLIAIPTDADILVVDDDSQDGTEEEVAALREEGYNISVLVRHEKGLSTAVLAGFERSNSEVCSHLTSMQSS